MSSVLFCFYLFSVILLTAVHSAKCCVLAFYLRPVSISVPYQLYVLVTFEDLSVSFFYNGDEFYLL